MLVLDEIHKIPGWAEAVKRLWDEDSRRRVPLRVVLLGSAPLLIQRGLTESLAGRFELLHLPHWTYPEMRQAFRWSLDQYVFYGGYPGAAPLAADPERWSRYVLDSLVEKLQVYNTALMTAGSGLGLQKARSDPEQWGRLIESAVGAQLANAAAAGDCKLYYWRDRKFEVDFVVQSGRRLVAIEVKSGRSAHALAGMEAFSAACKPHRRLLVGADGIPVEEFLAQPVSHWVRA